MKNTRIFEYVDFVKEFDVSQMVKTVNSEVNQKVLEDLLDLVNVRMLTIEDISKHYINDKNMLMFPVEIAKETDMETLEYVQSIIINRLENVEAGRIEPEPEQPKINPQTKIGFSRNFVQTEPPKTSTDKYKGTHMGFKRTESRITNFKNFLTEAKKRNVTKEVLKELSKRKREERLASGAKHQTKVVPDKKKQYNRQKSKRIQE